MKLETSSVFLKGGSRLVREVALLGKETVPGALVDRVAEGAGSQRNAQPSANNDVEFPAAGRLTFLLTQALPIRH